VDDSEELLRRAADAIAAARQLCMTCRDDLVRAQAACMPRIARPYRPFRTYIADGKNAEKPGH
jgi:hypothetical protein